MNTGSNFGSSPSPPPASEPTLADEETKQPPAPVTWLLIAVNALVYLAMAATTQHLWQFTTGDLLAWGGNFAPKVYGGDLWRSLTAIFVHGGVIHIGLNMWVLSGIGPFMERLLGATSYLLLYLFAGLAGNILGMMWHPDTVSVGASGAIFGLFGGLMGFLFVRRRLIPPEVLRSLMQNALYFVVINTVLGFSVPGIDVAAHILGALGGFVAGVIASWPLSLPPLTARVVRNGILGALCVGLVAATPYCVPSSAKGHARFLEAFHALQQREQPLRDRFNALMADASEENLHDEALAQRIDDEVLKPWTDMRAEFPPESELSADLRNRPITAVTYGNLAAIEEAFKLKVQAFRTGDEELHRRAAEKFREANQILDGGEETPPSQRKSNEESPEAK
jgi:rhomboid protease GluP